MGSIAYMDPKVVGTCLGHHPQPIGQNRFFKFERPGPPLNNLVFKIALATKPPLTGQESHLTIKCQLITAINADVLSLEIMFSLFK